MKTLSVRSGIAALALGGLLCAPVFVLADAPPASGRAYLGVAGVPEAAGQAGVVIRDVAPDSPAAKAGLKDGDRIVMVGDRAVKTFQELRDTLATHKPGDKLAFKVERAGKEQTLEVTLGRAPERQPRGPGAPERPGAFLGVFTQPLSAPMKERLKLKVDKGVLVVRVMPGSPAAKAGLAELDVITRVGDTAINSPDELHQAVEKAGAGKEVTLQVIRGDKTMDLKAKLAEEPRKESFFPGEGRMPEFPEGFGRFQNQVLPFLPGQEKVSALEKKVQELESRIDQLERSQNKPNR